MQLHSAPGAIDKCPFALAGRAKAPLLLVHACASSITHLVNARSGVELARDSGNDQIITGHRLEEMTADDLQLSVLDFLFNEISGSSAMPSPATAACESMAS